MNNTHNNTTPILTDVASFTSGVAYAQGLIMGSVGIGPLADQIKAIRQQRLLTATHGHGINNVCMDRRPFGLG